MTSLPHQDLQIIKKEFDRVTQTHTYTDKLSTHFQRQNQQIITERYNHDSLQRHPSHDNFRVQKIMKKVKSMQTFQLNGQKPANIHGMKQTLESQRNQIQKTEIDYGRAIQRRQFVDISPISNKNREGKQKELNQTLNTYVQSKQLINNEMNSYQTPKANKGNKISFKSIQNIYTPFNDLGNGEVKQTSINKSEFVNRNQPSQNLIQFNKASNIEKLNKRPGTSNYILNNINNTNINGMKNPILTATHNNAIHNNNAQKYSEINNQHLQQSQFNRQINIQQYQTHLPPTLYERNQYNNFIKSNNTRQSYIVPQQPVYIRPIGVDYSQAISPAYNDLQYKQIQIQRPNYQKLYNNKGQYYRTVGPQEDFIKQDKGSCSKILPFLGILALIITVLGTLFALGVLSGLIGGHNYLSKQQGVARKQDNNYTQPKNPIQIAPIIPSIPQPTIQKPVNQINFTQPIVAPIKPEEPITKPQIPIVRPQIPIINPQLPLVKPQQPVTKPEKPIEVPLVPIFKPQIPIIQPQVPIVKPQIPITITTINSSQILNPKAITNPQSTRPVANISVVPIVEPKPIDAVVVPKPIQTIIVPTHIQPAVIPTVVPLPKVQTSINPQPITPNVEPAITKPQKTINPQVINPLPVTIPQPVVKPVQTVVNPIQPVVNPIQPVVKPIQPVVKPIQPVVKPIQPVVKPQQPFTPIYPEAINSNEQTQNLVNIIIEQNKQVIPLNIKSSLKSDILNQVQNVPLNVRDVAKVQNISYANIENLLKNQVIQQNRQIVPINYKRHYLRNLKN